MLLNKILFAILIHITQGEKKMKQMTHLNEGDGTHSGRKQEEREDTIKMKSAVRYQCNYSHFL